MFSISEFDFVLWNFGLALALLLLAAAVTVVSRKCRKRPRD